MSVITKYFRKEDIALWEHILRHGDEESIKDTVPELYIALKNFPENVGACPDGGLIDKTIYEMCDPFDDEG